jgi:hypothetical protein
MVKILLILIIIAILMEDGSSIKKTEEEKAADKELAELVNKTLAEEAEKKKEEDEKEKKPDQEKKEDETKKKKIKEESSEGSGGSEGRDEALPSFNSTCPVCPEVQDCPVANCSGQCKACPRCKDSEKPEECPPCEDCPPVRNCGPCPAINSTLQTSSSPGCLESPGMSTPVAMVIGASISLVTMGAAAVVGLILRYVPPLVSGFLFLSVVFVVWFLSSQYPEMARDLGGRVIATLREATIALGHRMMEAIQRHQDQVGIPVNSILVTS